MAKTPPSEKERNPDSIWFSDDYGEYPFDRGNRRPEDGCCNAVLNHSLRRYGEKRYCANTKTTENGGCHFHKNSWTLRESREKKLGMAERDDPFTQAWVHNYRRIINQMPAHKKLSTISLFKSFRQSSTLEFGDDAKEIEVNTERVDWTDHDRVTVEVPVPKDELKAQEKALFMAACDFVRLESISEAMFEDAFDDGDARMAEKEIPVTSDGEMVMGDDGQPVTRKEEHHLNLPMSRITKDFERYLEFGGVLDEKDVDVSVDNRNFDVSLGPSEDDAHDPEARTPDEHRIDEELGLD